MWGTLDGVLRLEDYCEARCSRMDVKNASSDDEVK